MAPFVRSLVSWHALERTVDRWVSLGALALALAVCVSAFFWLK